LFYSQKLARFDVGLRELKQNPSDVISRAEAGTTFSVLRNGKRTSVVIMTEDSAKKSWVSADQLRLALIDIDEDSTGWLEQLEFDRESDPIVNPWDAS
jgi:antitoxin (DNA-binding transcriptional repressor) of toxin-antitoxin stability system